MNSMLVVTDSSGRTLARIELSGRRKITFGRDFNRDLVIDDPAVSRLHGVIYREDGQWCIADAGSRTGTHVDGERVRWKRLRPGRTARVGGVWIQVESDNPRCDDWLQECETSPGSQDVISDEPRPMSAFLTDPGDFMATTRETP